MKYCCITILLILMILTMTSCVTQQKNDTLRYIDVIGEKNTKTSVFIKPKTNKEIKAAYLEYIKHARTNNKSRMAAISRLAEIEFDLSDKLNDSKKISKNNSEWDEKKYYAGIDKTISLLTESINNYPNEKSNDRLLYQLSKAYEQKGDIKNSINTLEKLTRNYPNSIHYIESQFRIGEDAFIQKNYIAAEDAYTEVISSKKNALYFEKALFKRGWSRFKQSYYIEAIDDIISAIRWHHFTAYNTLDKSEKSQFNEYYRSIGLAFAYAGGIKPLRDYIHKNPELKFKYQIYKSVSDVYLKQQRFSDAASILKSFIADNNKSKEVPFAYLNIMDIWHQAGFTERLATSTNQFYSLYNPAAPYWSNKYNRKAIQKSVSLSLKKYILALSSHYHQIYQQDKKTENFNAAKLWYARYLKHYQSYIRKDNINFLYAGLLTEANKLTQALKYYETAAYDNNIILNKDAAYATIVTTNKLLTINKKIKPSSLLKKHIQYSILFSQLYPNDERTADILLHASEIAFKNKRFNKVIQITSLTPQNIPENILQKMTLLKAQSYFKLKKYDKAEQMYTVILKHHYPNSGNSRKLKDQLSLSIYKQAEVAKKHHNIVEATTHFIRISKIHPGSNIAITGLYDAIALFMQNQLWEKAISAMKKFQKLYPKHKLNKNIARKLSIAYLKSKQNIKAAQEFERLASLDTDKDIKKTALIQAAELYETNKNYNAAIRSYKNYITNYNKPDSQYIEILFKLMNLTKFINKDKQSYFWRKKIIQEESRIDNKVKTKRMKFIVASSLISLARDKNRQYQSIKLTYPLKQNLIKKKKIMQHAIQLYGKASVYKISEINTEATYSIGKIYNDFSKALLESELPKNLNTDEKEQYIILLEDKAFPFEEKAIEFHELNMEHSRDNIYNEWVKKSLANLKNLFPARYNRKMKVDRYINVLH